MLSLFKKKTYKEEKIAHLFIDQFFHTVDLGFPEVVALINESPEFITSPNIDENDSDKFLILVLAANITAISKYFPAQVDQIIVRKVMEQVSDFGHVDYNALIHAVAKDQKFISKVNHPSKNLVYGMSKAIFYKYELAQYQEEYFKNLNSPNPVLVKRLDEAMVNFLWDWEVLSTQSRI